MKKLCINCKHYRPKTWLKKEACLHEENSDVVHGRPVFSPYDMRNNLYPCESQGKLFEEKS
jgi:hypothetical protein